MFLGKSNKMTVSRCLKCGDALDMAAQVGGEGGPQPNDITICMSCGHVMAFTDDLSFRSLTDDELIEIARDHRVNVAIAALSKVKKQ